MDRAIVCLFVCFNYYQYYELQNSTTYRLMSFWSYYYQSKNFKRTSVERPVYYQKTKPVTHTRPDGWQWEENTMLVLSNMANGI